ncbi:MAG: hypothetical protein J6B10_02105 [Lachnospiraceae bacterium]|nr:hypothetical protein [Lachnospiraceae bacterium]
MYSYNMTQWLFFFYFYCLFGWCFESAYVSARQRQLVNRGFMRGPFLPLYGSGAIMMLVVSMPFRGNLLLTYISGCIGATALEYVTGVTMEALFKVRYWDYSNQKLNYKGHICLSSTIAWGFLTIFMTDVVHKPIEQFVLAIPMSVLSPVVFVLTVVIVVDFTLSFKAALDLRDVLVKMEHVKEEMERMQKRLDVLLAVADEEIENRIEARKQKSADRNEELLNALEDRFAGVKEQIRERYEAFPEDVREEIAELRMKFTSIKEKRLQLRSVRDFYKRHLILDNPTMHSEKFREALEELKRAAAEHRKQGSKEKQEEA